MSVRNDIYEALLANIEVIRTSETYDASPKKILSFIENYKTKFKNETPIMMMVDTGDDQLIVEDNLFKRFIFTIEPSYFISGYKWSEALEELNAFSNSIHEYIESSPDLGENFLALQFLENLGYDYNPKDNETHSLVRLQLIYCRPVSNSSVPGTDIYGEDFLDTAKNKIITELTALKTSMVSDDPTFSYIYEKHATAKLQLNAVSIELDSVEPTDEFANDYNVRYDLNYSIKVHTAYAGGYNDSRVNARLLNSILNKLKGNKDLGDHYRLANISEVIPDEEYEDSATLGGSLLATVQVVITHDEE